MTLDPLLLGVVTFLTGLGAGWVDAIAGGGGLITVPVLLWMGLPPEMVLGTNKFQASFGSATAAYSYVREGIVPLREALPGILWTLLGAAAGSWLVQQVDASALNLLIPVLLLAIALYMIFTPALGVRDRIPVLSRALFYPLAGAALGFYDGFFGPGVGSFWAIAFMLLLGFTLTRATGFTKVMNFTSNVVSLAVFAIGGHVLVGPGLLMAAGQIVGARLGSGMVITRGARFIRPVFITIVIATTLKLLYARLG
jgi:uncharacterized membrane protein YfcA